MTFATFTIFILHWGVSYEMPGIIHCKERADSGVTHSAGEGRTFETTWDIFQHRTGVHAAMDRTDAELALRQFAPFVVFDPFYLDPEHNLYAQEYHIEMLDSHHALGRVEYRPLNPIDNLPPRVPGEQFSPPTFRVYGETINARLSLRTRSQNARPGKNAADRHQLIEVDAEGNVNGANIQRTKMEFHIPRYYPFSLVSRAWINSLGDICNTVCDHPFLGAPVGEMYLIGVEGGPNYEKHRMEINIHILRSPNQYDLVIDGITVPEVRGHDYVWGSYIPIIDSGGTQRATELTQVNVEQVYYERSWSQVFGFS